MQLLFLYCRLHWKAGGLFLIFCGVFVGLFALFELPLTAVLYAGAICAFIGAVVTIPDYLAFCRRHKQLQALVSEITISADGFPTPCGPLEDDYQAILRALYADKQRLTDEMTDRYTDLVEYYTVWAHQIKTPIAAMRLILQSQDEDTEQNRELAAELQRIEQYVEMVLCYLRLDANSTDYVIKEYDLDSILKQGVRKYASQFIRRKIRLEYEPLCCRVLTDEKWLLFVVEQVLSNSLKYTKSGGKISITMDEPKLLCIRDTGIGIAPEDLPRIFEKGFTGYNGRNDKKASGIGLYLSRRICDNLGHKITASSAVGSGTIIRIDLKKAELEIE